MSMTLVCNLIWPISVLSEYWKTTLFAHYEIYTFNTPYFYLCYTEVVQPKYTACSRKQRAFNETSNYEKFFLTYPECREDGSFEAVQCNHLRGLCFCVHTITGEKFEHTETLGKPDCSYFEENTCEWKEEKFYLGEKYYEDCNLW